MPETKKTTRGVEIESSIISTIKERIKGIPDFKEEIEKLLEQKTTNVLDTILGGAIFLDMSDIHIEPEEEKAKIRGRIDGMLQDIVFFDIKIYKSLISRLKVLSKLKINITDQPQDGRFSVVFEENEIEIRVSVIPAEYGEAIVLRILNPQSLISIEELGLRKDLVSIFEKEIKKPTGMMIVAGPTGAGKTTTLYAILKKINKPEVKIITIEDPIEYHLDGLSQTQVNPKKGYDFASGLRSIMRQDPNVILVGEIRDVETSKITVQAALTGHLVLSTVHTNDASGAIIRLINLGADPSSTISALNMIIAQRLPRRVCKNCGELVYSPEKEKMLKEELKDLPKEILPPSFFEKEIKIIEPKGCKQCSFTGYKGRIGIYEIISIDKEIEKSVLSSSISATSLKEAALKKGMISLKKDGLIKVLEGITTIEEIERVAG
ncbi:MAG: GspE/PulE family protein [Candidatus Pacebacteria bacterium]|nr:GspE/PulE family protein [Candidatus Paceibacterota bacterium]